MTVQPYLLLWVEVVRLLIDAGASRDGVWISSKPPSEEVTDLLRGYGIKPDYEPEPGPDDEDDPAPSLGTGVMADVARHLVAAYHDLDHELLGSLLHPDVRWTGVCNDSAQVIDWYLSLMADGIRSARIFVIEALTSSPSIQLANVTAPLPTSSLNRQAGAISGVEAGG